MIKYYRHTLSHLFRDMEDDYVKIDNNNQCWGLNQVGNWILLNEHKPWPLQLITESEIKSIELQTKMEAHLI